MHLCKLGVENEYKGKAKAVKLASPKRQEQVKKPEIRRCWK